jgi:phospholipase/carboxylesterase
MAHGRDDPVIPLARATASRDRLVAAGYAVQWHEYAMPHSVCEDEIRAIAAFLKRVVPQR